MDEIESSSMDNRNIISDDGDDVVEVGEDTFTTNESTKNPKKRQRKLRSQVWNFFEKLPLDDNNIQKAKCKFCSNVYNAESKNGTGTLSRHMKNCPRRNMRDVGQLIIGGDKEKMLLKTCKFDIEHFRELVAAAVVMHDLPFQFIEYDGIRACFEYLCPDVRCVSRNTIKADILKMYTREKARMKSMLESTGSRISLISDCWSSITMDGYLCLTAHFIDNDWILHKRVLNFCFLPPPHSGVALCDKIISLLCEWGIDNQIFSLTLDNASANDVSAELLINQFRGSLVANGKLFHVRCCAHIVNLVVQDGLKDIEPCVHKIRESIKYVRGSQSRKLNFLEVANQMKLDSKKGLRQDVATRWNFTYLMLESALFYRRAFCHLALLDSNYKHCLDASEWEKVEKICNFLALFYEISTIFSGTKYPTANLYFPCVSTCYEYLKMNVESDDVYIRDMATKMLPKFEKYWSDFSLNLALAVVVDPRYKLDFVDFSYEEIYGFRGSPAFLKVRETLFSLFGDYAKKLEKNPAGDSSNPTHGSTNVGLENNILRDERKKKLMKFRTFNNDGSFNIQKSQLELYLDEPRLNCEDQLDILAYWKSNQYRYPEVASLARDILCIPISTVASEAAFSVGGRVLDQYRSALKPSTVEAIICTRDWLYGDRCHQQQLKIEELTEDIMQMDITSDVDATRQSSNLGSTSL